MTPTLDHNDHEPRGGCRCTAWKLCARCYATQERERAEQQLDEWLARFGLQVDKPARARPMLRLVR